MTAKVKPNCLARNCGAKSQITIPNNTNRKAATERNAHSEMLMESTSERKAVTKNISEAGTTLSTVLERAMSRLKRMSSSDGSSKRARS